MEEKSSELLLEDLDNDELKELLDDISPVIEANGEDIIQSSQESCSLVFDECDLQNEII